jgi:hypothetical protein
MMLETKFIHPREPSHPQTLLLRLKITKVKAPPQTQTQDNQQNNKIMEDMTE